MNNVTLIADFLKKNFPIEQIKYKMYIEEDIYYRIPVLVFRFSKELNTGIYSELKVIVESFEGNIRWTVFESFYGKKVRNYLLCPKKLYNMQKDLFERKVMMSEKEYFLEKDYKDLCSNGIKDIPNLFEHIKEKFKPNMKNYL